MATQYDKNKNADPMQEAIAAANQVGVSATKMATNALMVASEEIMGAATAVAKTSGPATHKWVEQTTETVGKVVSPIIDNPMIKFVSKLPIINWLMSALGEVDTQQVQKEVSQLRQQYPNESDDQLAHRIIVDTAMKAGGIGLATNLIPPLALSLLAIDLAAVSKLQAEMLYRIAAVYGFSLADPTRRGEVLTIFGFSLGGSRVLKAGLSFAEIIPGAGAFLGASSNAALIYSLGFAANQFYQNKTRLANRAAKRQFA
ncbi:hypothetical protein H6G89_12045 [Oscillatoria sp. FACHB-1407]|uniref:hypothetical protein n=1 Tax=Oscillatoria sp. FACHB-1407 TaxID=2692847 RepID=UPI00168A3AC4|nr:hypothetical protein [Oscillatoria sp. FACHB-1407]MBD2461782.1 hypothetical protein [Oscillatoria sp. FACHB-1407]